MGLLRAARLLARTRCRQRRRTSTFSDPCFVKAGEDLQALPRHQAVPGGFLGTPAQQGAGSSAGLVANGKAAMELQGHWNGGVIAGLTPDKKASADKLGWFPFPAVAGGAGAPDAALGGGDGFSCSTKAPPACVEFLKYMLSAECRRSSPRQAPACRSTRRRSPRSPTRR